MKNKKHTPGPWVAHVSMVNELTGNDVILIRSVRPIFGIADIEDDCEAAQANAARIVACVNALEGVKRPEAMPSLLMALADWANGKATATDVLNAHTALSVDVGGDQ